MKKSSLFLLFCLLFCACKDEDKSILALKFEKIGQQILAQEKFCSRFYEYCRCSTKVVNTAKDCPKLYNPEIDEFSSDKKEILDFEKNKLAGMVKVSQYCCGAVSKEQAYFMKKFTKECESKHNACNCAVHYRPYQICNGPLNIKACPKGWDRLHKYCCIRPRI